MKPRVVICGSYHRQPQKLARLFRELEVTGCRILSPFSVNFLDLQKPIVRTTNDHGINILDMENYHLRALRDADLIWLHAPDGHVGVSGAYELGYAEALHKPVFSFEAPADEMLRVRVKKVASVFEALELLSL